jgi:hypothetical protein
VEKHVDAGSLPFEQHCVDKFQRKDEGVVIQVFKLVIDSDYCRSQPPQTIFCGTYRFPTVQAHQHQSAIKSSLRTI